MHRKKEIEKKSYLDNLDSTFEKEILNVADSDEQGSPLEDFLDKIEISDILSDLTDLDCSSIQLTELSDISETSSQSFFLEAEVNANNLPEDRLPLASEGSGYLELDENIIFLERLENRQSEDWDLYLDYELNLSEITYIQEEKESPQIVPNEALSPAENQQAEITMEDASFQSKKQKFADRARSPLYLNRTLNDRRGLNPFILFNAQNTQEPCLNGAIEVHVPLLRNTFS